MTWPQGPQGPQLVVGWPLTDESRSGRSVDTFPISFGRTAAPMSCCIFQPDDGYCAMFHMLTIFSSIEPISIGRLHGQNLDTEFDPEPVHFLLVTFARVCRSFRNITRHFDRLNRRQKRNPKI